MKEKEYKLVNSKEVQEKAFRLGHQWCSGGKRARNLEYPFIYINRDKYLTFGSLSECFNEHEHEEITQKDFLSLPEPINVGEYIKFTNEDGSIIFKVGSIIGEDVLPTEPIKSCLGKEIVGFNINNCIKLTPNQLELLGLS